jgi:hypothetical protein
MFERPYHQRVAKVLESLDAGVLRSNGCLFGGGTAMALRYGEYRESVDIDFLVSDVKGYRQVRQMATGPAGINALLRPGAPLLSQAREVRADQYGVRSALRVDDVEVKFEIVLEARIELAAPAAGDVLCGISTLGPQDMAAGKLLANCDRWSDDGVFSRDLIDLAMMGAKLPLLRQAVAKAQQAYGESVLKDLGRAIDRMQTREGWLERCTRALAMDMPRALLWQKIRALRRVLPKEAPAG